MTSLPSPLLRPLGVLACLGYAAHATYHVLNGTPWDALWICHAAALAIGVGLIFGGAGTRGQEPFFRAPDPFSVKPAAAPTTATHRSEGMPPADSAPFPAQAPSEADARDSPPRRFGALPNADRPPDAQPTRRFGALLNAPALNAAGLILASLGLPSWVLYLLSGEPLIPTSLLTHVLAPALAIAGVRSLGFPKASPNLAFILVVLVTALARAFTPAEANVNLAFGPIAGLSLWTARPPLHYLFLFVQWVIGIRVAHLAWRGIFTRLAWLNEAPENAG